MKQLYRLYRPDEGEICFDNVPQQIHSPADAIRLGIGMIHQHFMLVNSLTVAENVALGLKSSRGFVTDLDVVSKRIEELAELYGLKVDPKAYIWQLSVGQQQRVEIIKALYRGAALLILDEPTAVLTPQEVNDFFITLRHMASDGHGLIFISHKLQEVMDFTDRVTVLRDGRNVATVETKRTNKEELARLMVGRELKLRPDRPVVELGAVRLSLKNLSALGDRGTLALDDVSFEIYAGEIVGLAGVSGNGQLELAETIAGLRPLNSGQISIDNENMSNKNPAQMIEAGLSFIPEERNRDGMIRDFSIAENLILRENDKPPFVKGMFLDFKAMASHAQKMVESFRVKTPSIDTPIKNLSGGNAQKVILARELARRPKVLIAAQPTRGVDIGATEYVRERLVAQRQEGTATLLISEDLDEILALCDRIAVLFHGKLMGIVKAGEATLESLGLMIAGEGQG
ncbi:MAG: ABC transporter ATP-binding protein [Deinococcales bacterium]